MENSDKKEVADKWDPANAVTPFQIRAFLNMANVGNDDVLYDLGSGHGRVARLAVTYGKVKRAIGIEHILERFCHARMLAKKDLTKRQLSKGDFWFEELDDLKSTDVADATVVYYGLDPQESEDKMFRKLLRKRKVRIIRKDLPIIGYAPTASSRESSTSRFILMSYPFKHRIKSKDA